MRKVEEFIQSLHTHTHTQSAGSFLLCEFCFSVTFDRHDPKQTQKKKPDDISDGTMLDGTVRNATLISSRGDLFCHM